MFYIGLSMLFMGIGLTVYSLKFKNSTRVETQNPSTKCVYTDSNKVDMLTSILEESFKSDTVSEASDGIIAILKGYYKVHFITMLIANKKNGYMTVTATNVSKKCLKTIEKYCNSVNKELHGTVRELSCEEGNISYDIENRGVCYSIFLPLKDKDKTIGGILLEHRNLEVSENRYNLYDEILVKTTLVLRGLIHRENLLSLVSTDQLTGVFNRRYLDMTIEEQIKLHEKLGQSFNVALFDIDFFKKFNDTYGHQFGDLVLQDLSAFIKNTLGEHSWIARYGGEEFILFFGRSNQNKVFNKVEEIRKSVEELDITDGVTHAGVHISIGVANYPNHAKDVEGLIHCADTALYHAKEHGRNQSVMYSEDLIK